MNTLTRTLIVIFLLMSLAFTAFLLFNSHHHKTQQNRHSELQIDEMMLGVEAKQFDASGHLKQILSTASITHYQGETTSNLDRPSLTMYQNDGSNWTLAAKMGQSHQQRMGSKVTQVNLSEDVEVQFADRDKKMWYFTTHHLKIDPEKKWVSTSDPVIVKSDSMTLKAQGMQAALEQRQIQFLNRVTTDYEIPNT